MTIEFRSVALGVTLGASAVVFSGCKDDTGELETVDCKWKYKKDECQEIPPKGGNDEVGDGDGDNEGEAEIEFCTVKDDGEERTVFQCNGHLTASMEFKTILGDCAKTLGDPEWCRESHTFGVGLEPYELPAVMACCDAVGTPEEELLTYCAMDLVEQVCRSIPMRLEDLLNDDVIKIGKNQAIRLLDWLNDAGNQQACYDSLYAYSGSPGVVMPASWKVNGGGNKNWPALESFTVRLDKAVVNTATLPQKDGDRLGCVDNSLNNTEIFEESGPLHPSVVETYHLGDSFAVSIDGPTLPDGGIVVGDADVLSQSRCQPPSCSSLAISVDPQTDLLVLEDLNLFADGPAQITYGDMSVDIDRAALRLYGVSQGSYYFLNELRGAYIIEPGEADFVISGTWGGVLGFRWASNTSRIAVYVSDGGWTIDSFTVSHSDGAGESWTLTVPPTTWD